MSSLAHRPQQTTLVDLLDRLLDKGVVVAGDLTISVGDVGLLFASLRLVLTSVDKAWEVRSGGTPASLDDGSAGGAPATSAPHGDGAGRTPAAPSGRAGQALAPAPMLPAAAPGEPRPSALAGEPVQPSNGIAQIVVTLAETLRETLEREALRRMERGTLSPEEIARLGRAFLAMKRQIEQMKRIFQLRDEDLNLDLGPLGTLR